MIFPQSEMKLRLLLACVGYVTIMGSNLWAGFTPSEGVSINQMLGDAKVKQVIIESPEVQVFRLGEAKKVPAPVTFKGPKIVDLKAVLTDVRNYGGQHMCDFMPAIKFRFATGDDTLDVVICFACGDMFFNFNGSAVRRENIPWVGRLNSFSPAARKVFVSLAKKAFPDDLQIQGLP